MGINEPQKNYRTSANTRNYYTYIIDNSENWKDFPKRSKSLICRAYINQIPTYNGYDYYVIPIDKEVKFGVCNDSDLWTSFKNLYEYCDIFSLMIFNKSLEIICNIFGISIEDETTVEEFFGYLGELTEKLKDKINIKDYVNSNDIDYGMETKLLYEYLYSSVLNGKSCRDAIENLLNPVDNNINCVSFGNCKIILRLIFQRNLV